MTPSHDAPRGAKQVRQRRRVSYQWRLREVMAEHKMYATTELVPLLAERGVRAVNLLEWQTIEAAEIANAREGAPRKKFVSVAEMLAALG